METTVKIIQWVSPILYWCGFAFMIYSGRRMGKIRDGLRKQTAELREETARMQSATQTLNQRIGAYNEAIAMMDGTAPNDIDPDHVGMAQTTSVPITDPGEFYPVADDHPMHDYIVHGPQMSDSMPLSLPAYGATLTEINLDCRKCQSTIPEDLYCGEVELCADRNSAIFNGVGYCRPCKTFTRAAGVITYHPDPMTNNRGEFRITDAPPLPAPWDKRPSITQPIGTRQLDLDPD